jgi:hypothetical protein
MISFLLGDTGKYCTSKPGNKREHYAEFNCVLLNEMGRGS